MLSLKSVHSGIGKGEEGLTYPTVHTFEADHPTVAILQMRKSCLSHCAHTRARKGWPIPLCTLLRLSIPLWPFYKWEELPIPLWTHKGEEGLTYHTVHTFEAATVVCSASKCAQCDRQGRGRADLSHCAHFWGWASHCGHFTNEKSCQSHCGHTRARKGWPITLCTLWGWAYHCGHCTNEKSCLSHCAHTRAREGLTYPTVHTFEAEHPTVAILQMRRAAYPTVHTQGRGRADLSHCAHFWGWASHSGHCTNEKRCLSHCAHISPSSPLCVHSGIGSSSHL